VNYFGVVETARRFIPLLRASKGRLFVTGSVAGNVAVPFGQPYSATKYAVRSLSDSLRRELKPVGVAVVRIEPGFVETPILQSGMSSNAPDSYNFWKLPEAEQAPYLALFTRTIKGLKESASKALTTDSTNKDLVHAMSSSRPLAVYHPGSVKGNKAGYFVAFMNSIGAHAQDFVLSQF
jgi:NAD(P)-dependent dehydrogenase (short-subunit alcohol dehydrogenase family)